KLPVSVEIAPSGTTVEGVTQEVFIVKKEAKLRLLSKLLTQYQGAVLLFSRTKYNARKIMRSIRDMGHSAAEIHSNRSLSQRREALEGFKSGRYKVLVATDIASRGIDVTGIELVINYDLPEEAQNYVHRIGRTARAGHKGHAISFAMPEQARDVREIEKIIRKSLPISKHPEISQEHFIQSAHQPSAKPPRRNYPQKRQRYQRS
ncbi:MAG: C-terminal helicase domain-containing protein, partial [Candidatus Omnitrophica bacterium]|nr:C-terminal helicase domain-containing protein [Candidatus Omnitrophota bacterium]